MQFKNLYRIFLFLIFCSSISCSKYVEVIDSPAVENFKNSSLLSWNALQLKLIRSTPGFAPPVAARALAYTNLAAYEVIAAGSTNHKSIASQLNGLTAIPDPQENLNYNWELAASAAMNYMILKFYPNASASAKAEHDSLYSLILSTARSKNDYTNVTNSISYGESVAATIYSWAILDGGEQAQLDNFPIYNFPVGDQYWVPEPNSSYPLLSRWGNNRPILVSNAGVIPPVPLPFSSQAGTSTHTEFMEVYQLSQTLTPEQLLIAKYWADGAGSVTPGGHSLSIAMEIVKQKNLNLVEASKLFVQETIAVSDAFICCWKTKFTYNTIRPITYIRRYIDAAWTPALPTPPFPEHCSGHSTQSGAAAEVLTQAFGTTSFTDHTNDAIGFAPRSFPDFYSFGNEAMNSRLYGGIHIVRGNVSGLEMGKQVGNNVMQLQFLK